MTPDITLPEGEVFALFPLNVVLFPGGLLPLRIFEPRYQRMVAECLRDQRPFVVAAIVDGPEAGGVAKTAQTGTLAGIIDWDQGDDGLLNLVCEGGQRVAVESVDVERDRLLRARVRRLPDEQQTPLPDEFRWAAELLDEILQRIGEPFSRLADATPTAEHVSARLIELLPFPISEKQAMFELDGGVARLHRLATLVAGGAEARPRG